MFSEFFYISRVVLIWPGIFGIVVKQWKEKDFDNVYSREGMYIKVAFFAAAPARRMDCAGHCVSINHEF